MHPPRSINNKTDSGRLSWLKCVTSWGVPSSRITKSDSFRLPTTRAVFFCKTSASTVTRSTSTFTTSAGWVPGLLSALTDLSRVCELMCDETYGKRNSNKTGERYLYLATAGYKTFISTSKFRNSQTEDVFGESAL